MTALLSVLLLLPWGLAIIFCTNLVWRIPGLRRIAAAAVIAQLKLMEEMDAVLRVRGHSNRL